MAIAISQDKRTGVFNTPSGDTELAVASFKGTEGLSKLFEYEVEVVNTKKLLLRFDDLLGTHCTVSLRTLDGSERHFDGIMTEAKWIMESDEGNVYRVIMRPWLWVLSKRVNCLIFRGMTVNQIIKKIFGDHGGLADFKDSCSKSYPVLEYCTQYRESDMAFVCRLMEQHGISYHFEHEKSHHKLVMADSFAAYKKVPGTSRPFIAVEKHRHSQVEHLFRWQPERKFTTGMVTLKDYDFKKPSAALEAEKEGNAKYAHGHLEDFDYPGNYVEQSVGKAYAQSRLDMIRGEDDRYYAEGDCQSIEPGYLMTLKDHPDGEQNQTYLVLNCRHSFSGQLYRSGGQEDIEAYEGEYEFARDDKPFAPEIVTEKPFVYGPQTAKVIGEGEIDCDEYGRIIVRFHWDRKSDQSRRVRVAQVWASQQWGAIFTPRVGMEVVVDFLEGDPDQPIVIGCVYNAENKPPYPLPDKKNISGWKSNSTTGGGGYNELVMDDTKGTELVRFQAEKDLGSLIKNDENRKVQNDRTTTIEHDDKLNVTNELTIDVGMKITIKCGKSSITMDPMSITIESPSITVHASMDLSTKSDMLAKHEGTAFLVVKGGMVNIN